MPGMTFPGGSPPGIERTAISEAAPTAPLVEPPTIASLVQRKTTAVLKGG